MPGENLQGEQAAAERQHTGPQAIHVCEDGWRQRNVPKGECQHDITLDDAEWFNEAESMAPVSCADCGATLISRALASQLALEAEDGIRIEPVYASEGRSDG